ncbi:MAG: arginase family protein, partial [Candidatus Azotimanducaceae bacterium WSBS_2022_MAG_OTU7]
MKPISLIPFVCGAGASTEGSEQGPIDLLQRGLQKDLQASGADVEWVESPVAVFDREHGAAAYQDLPALGTDGRKEIVMHHCCYLRDKVVATINQGRLPITLGGDHSMAAGSIAGLAQARQAHGKIGVIWIDAHADINTPENSASKALHGMPVAALLGMGDDDFKSIGGLDKPVLEPHHIFYLGLRDVETAEQEYLDELGIQA